MTKLLIALGITFAASTAALADSAALDAYSFPAHMGSESGMIDYTATASYGTANPFELGPRLGDGSPVHTGQMGGVDYTPTASIGYTTGLQDTFAVSPRAL